MEIVREVSESSFFHGLSYPAHYYYLFGVSIQVLQMIFRDCLPSSLDKIIVLLNANQLYLVSSCFSYINLHTCLDIRK